MTPANPSTNISDLRKLVFDEFKLAQDKIDRIGEFLFKIRAWAITGNSGLTIAVLSEKLTPFALVVGIVATFGFWHLEKHQRYLRDGFSDRAIALEAALSKLTASMSAKASDKAVIRSVVRSLQQQDGLAVSSRREFTSAKARETYEDNLYVVQLGTIMLIFYWGLLKNQAELAYCGATDLGALIIQRLMEVIHCG